MMNGLYWPLLILVAAGSFWAGVRCECYRWHGRVQDYLTLIEAQKAAKSRRKK